MPEVQCKLASRPRMSLTLRMSERFREVIAKKEFGWYSRRNWKIDMFHITFSSLSCSYAQITNQWRFACVLNEKKFKFWLKCFFLEWGEVMMKRYEEKKLMKMFFFLGRRKTEKWQISLFQFYPKNRIC